MTIARRTTAATALALALCVSSTAALAAARPVIYSNTTKVVGNDVKIKSTNGSTTVDASNSCSPGVTGFLYQSIMVMFGGSTYGTVQSTTCP